MDRTREETRIFLAPGQYPDPGFAEHDCHAALVRRIDALESAVRDLIEVVRRQEGG